MEKASHREHITLGPHETRAIAIDRSAWSARAVEKPQLWWPNGHGEPVLHRMQWSVECDGAESDRKTVCFGIRKIEYQTDKGTLRISVNGHTILCRGGNWGMDDGMLLCDEDGYDLRLRLHRDMHFVMIRNWVGMVGSDKFYEACDRYGMLIWDDFWLANPGDAPDPSDHLMFLRNVRDKVRRVRSHAALALYCGRNEGDPPPDLDRGMRDAVAQLDGTRLYIPASTSGLVTGHGPYDDQDPAWYFANRGDTFHSEQGIVCVPNVEGASIQVH
jgi:beta-galactosidase/beta-glucuronidase